LTRKKKLAKNFVFLDFTLDELYVIKEYHLDLLAIAGSLGPLVFILSERRFFIVEFINQIIGEVFAVTLYIGLPYGIWRLILKCRGMDHEGLLFEFYVHYKRDYFSSKENINYGFIGVIVYFLILLPVILSVIYEFIIGIIYLAVMLIVILILHLQSRRDR